MTSIDGAPAGGGALARALRGAPGTELLVGVRRAGASLVVRVTREVLYR